MPAIHEPFESGLDRYKVFNSGRHKAFCQWWETAEALLNQVPTASGVGHCGADLVIHCLATDQPGVGIENPRQIPSLGYSRRYGPRPPCFARATLHGKRLLVGGTASILGEESTHPDDLESQFRETLTNVAAVASRAIVRLGKANASVGQLNEEKILSLFSSLRIYHPKRRDQKWIQRETQPRFPGLTEIEYLRADLCRPELLVEIEGVADLS